MHDDAMLAAWSKGYAEWLERSRPLLMSGRHREASADYDYPVSVYTPWAPVVKPLSATRLALITTGGFYLRDSQPRFTIEGAGDHTSRRLPENLAPDDLAIAHDYFPHALTESDWNVILPMDHLRERVAGGQLGGLGPIFSISGHCYNAAALVRETARPMAEAICAAGCDAALLIPV